MVEHFIGVSSHVSLDPTISEKLTFSIYIDMKYKFYYWNINMQKFKIVAYMLNVYFFIVKIWDF